MKLNDDLLKKEYNEPKLVFNCFVADVLLSSGGSKDAFGNYNMEWFKEE